MTDYRVELAVLDLPEFGLPQVEPTIPATTYDARIAAARTKASDAGYDVLIVYADREHYGNMVYLTNFDPRFEEALLILAPDRAPTLLAGIECVPYARAISPAHMNIVLYPPFSLVSMPRDATQPLAALLQDAGVEAGMRVGVAGWKYYTSAETDTPQEWIEAPAFIVDTLRAMGCTVVNASALFIHPSHGLRTINDVDQLARFEYAATLCSQGMRNLLFNIRPGMSEYEAMQSIGWMGMPLNAHPVLASGERTALALPSPSARRFQIGDPIFGGFGYWGAMIARGGFVVESADQLPEGIRDYLDKLVKPYFCAAVAWYETIGIGVNGSTLYAAVHQHVGDPFFGVGLNPGHLTHVDEWVSSLVYKGSTEQVRSGMAFQVDIIPATGTAYHTSNIEDGIAIADESLREQFAQKYPEAWSRIQQRRAFMHDVLGIRLKPEVLPFSNIPAYLPPYWLAPKLALRVS